MMDQGQCTRSEQQVAPRPMVRPVASSKLLCSVRLPGSGVMVTFVAVQSNIKSVAMRPLNAAKLARRSFVLTKISQYVLASFGLRRAYILHSPH